MRIHIIPVTCDVCGEGGMSTPNDSAQQWFGGQMVHTDPRVCAENLAAKRRKFEREKEEWERSRASSSGSSSTGDPGESNETQSC